MPIPGSHRGAVGRFASQAGLGVYTPPTPSVPATERNIPLYGTEYSIKGLAWPFKFYAGRITMSMDEKHIMESVKQLLAIDKFEYLMIPELGCDLGRRVFDPINTAALVEGDIRDTLVRFEPRVMFISTAVDIANVDLGVLAINVRFRIRGKDEISSVSFEFRR